MARKKVDPTIEADLSSEDDKMVRAIEVTVNGLGKLLWTAVHAEDISEVEAVANEVTVGIIAMVMED